MMDSSIGQVVLRPKPYAGQPVDQEDGFEAPERYLVIELPEPFHLRSPLAGD